MGVRRNIATGYVGRVVSERPVKPRTLESKGHFVFARTRGVKALYLLLQRSGFQTERRRRGNYQLETSATLWQLTTKVDKRRRRANAERSRLLSAVRRGLTLVTTPRRAASLLNSTTDRSANVKVVARELVSGSSRWNQALTFEKADNLTGRDPNSVLASSASGACLICAWSIGSGRIIAFGAPSMATNEYIGKASNGPFLCA